MGFLAMFRNAVIVFAITLFIYLTFAGRFKFDFPRTNRDYFTRLSYSFLHGKLDIPSPGYSPNDLSLYNGRYFLYRGPLPALVIMPFVYMMGTNISDVFYTAVFGSLNVLFLYLLLSEFIKFKKLIISVQKVILLLACFTFGSLHFYLSVLGTMWFTSQIVSLGVYILSLYFLFRYLNTKKRNSNLFLSVIFLGVSFWGRFPFLLSLPLYISLIYREKTDKSPQKWFPFIPLLFFPVSVFIYNYFRFGDVFESGLKYMQLNGRYFEDLVKYGYFNLHFVLYNLYYFLLHPIIPDPEGTSIFITTPVFLLLVLSFFKKHFQSRKNSFLSGVIFISAIFVLFPAFIFNGTGWYQFGYRYALDIYPLLFLLLLLIIDKYRDFTISILIIASIAINIFGTLWMMDFARYAYF